MTTVMWVMMKILVEREKGGRSDTGSEEENVHEIVQLPRGPFSKYLHVLCVCAVWEKSVIGALESPISVMVS